MLITHISMEFPRVPGNVSNITQMRMKEIKVNDIFMTTERLENMKGRTVFLLGEHVDRN